MSGWILTAGLVNLRNQVNNAFPDRSTASDGTIGDAAHQAETSGHNPDDTPGAKPEWNGDPDTVPEVRAWDCTSTFGDGVDAQTVVDHIRGLPGLSSVIRYMIYNRVEYHERDGFAGTAYKGASAHTEHIHFSGAFTQAADNNTAFDYHLEEIPVALNADDKTWIAAQIAEVVSEITQFPVEVDPDRKPGDPGKVARQPWSRVDGYGSMERRRLSDKLDKVLALLTPPVTPPAPKS